MLTFDERKQDWLVQPFGLRRLERLDAIQAERVSFSPQHFKCYLQVCVMTYRKIPKISPGAYIFSKALFGGLFLEGLIFGGAYLRREICVTGLGGSYLRGLYMEGLIFGILRYSHQRLNFYNERCKCRFTFACNVLILFPLCRKGAIFRI